MNTSRVKVIASSLIGKIFSIFGYIVGVMFLLVIFVGLEDLESEGSAAALIFCFIIVAFCIYLIIKGAQIKRRIKRFKAYVGLISMQHMTSLDNLAASTSQSVDFVRNDIQKMIDKKFFANAYIDRQTNEVVIGGVKSQPQATISYQPVQQNTAVHNETVRCPGCGATNLKQVGVVSSCEYCGSPLK